MKIIKGDISIDDRGSVSFINEFNFDNIKRAYIVENYNQGFIRAWHGHKNEEKYVQVISGSALIAGVKIDNWDKPSLDLEVHKFVLSEFKPSILYIPRGYANGFKTLSVGSKLIFYSTSTLEDSINDDFRFKFDLWNPWDVEYR